jgi:hypothetical protein
VSHVLRDIPLLFQWLSCFTGSSMQHARDMIFDPTASKMIGALARGWARDKYRRDKQFHKTVLYEQIDSYVATRRHETGENETEAVDAAAELFSVDKRTVERARKHVREMHSSEKKK